MFTVTVTTPKGRSTQVECPSDYCTIGKGRDNMVVLHGWRLAERHAEIAQGEQGGLYLEDRGSRAGTLVNGERIKLHGPLLPTDRIEIGGYVITVQMDRKQSQQGRGFGGASPILLPDQIRGGGGAGPGKPGLGAAKGQPFASASAGMYDEESFTRLINGLEERFLAAKEVAATLQTVNQELMLHIEAEASSIFILENRDSEIVCRACAGPVNITGLRIKAGFGIVGESIDSQTPKMVRDTRTDPKFLNQVDETSGFTTKSILCIPLIANQRCFGAVEMFNKSRRMLFDEVDQERLILAAGKLAEALSRVHLAPLSKNDAERQELAAWRYRIHQELLRQIDLRRIDISSMDNEELGEVIYSLVEEIITRQTIPEHLNREKLARGVLNEAIGLGPLEEFLADETITEIMVNCHDEIFIERKGRLERSDITFTSPKAVFGAIERIVAPLGRRIDESSPMVDGRLQDGSRVNAVIPPLALKGPCITIRKFGKKNLTSHELVKFGALTPAMVELLRTAVHYRQNIVISGGTGSGKTTLLNLLSSYIPADERIVTVEDAAELRLTQPNLVSLEARPPNMQGKGEVTIRDLVRNCLRMRPDRIVVGECRGGETIDMLQAMNTGHDGSLTTAHANTPHDLLLRLEVMVLMSGMELPVLAIREQISSAVNLIVQQSRFADGSRKVTHISEVIGVEGGMVRLRDIFLFKQHGMDEAGKVRGEFVATGVVPRFFTELQERGIEVNPGIFRP